MKPIFFGSVFANSFGSLSMICSIFHALIRCIKFIRDQQMHFNFTDMLMLYYGH